MHGPIFMSYFTVWRAADTGELVAYGTYLGKPYPTVLGEFVEHDEGCDHALSGRFVMIGHAPGRDHFLAAAQLLDAFELPIEEGIAVAMRIRAEFSVCCFRKPPTPREVR